MGIGLDPETSEQVLVLALVALVIWGLVKWHLWGKRFLETRTDRRGRVGTGEKWEQDAPYPECFDEMGEDE